MDNRTEAGRILGMPPLVTRSQVEDMLGISRGNLGKRGKDTVLPEAVYSYPCTLWRKADIEVLVRARRAMKAGA